MNNELQEALTVFLTKSLDAVEKGVNMAGEQIPLVLQEIIQWELLSSSAGMVFCLVSAIGFIFFYKYTMREINKSERWTDRVFFLGAGAIASVILSVASLVYFTVWTFAFIKALCTPRLVIIEFLKGML